MHFLFVFLDSYHATYFDPFTLSELINQLFSIFPLGCNFLIIHADNDVSPSVKITLLLIIRINAKLEILILTGNDNNLTFDDFFIISYFAKAFTYVSDLV